MAMTSKTGNQNSMIFAPIRINKLWGFIDISGEMVIEPAFKMEPDDNYPHFDNGRAIVKSGSNERYGVIDAKGDWLAKPEYYRIYNYSEGLATVQLENDSPYNKMIDSTGKCFDFGEFELVGRFCEGLAPAVKNSRYGYLNRQGLMVIPLKFYDAHEFSEGLAAIDSGRKIDSRGNRISRYGFIDNQGKMVIAAQYDFVFAFRNGVSIISLNGKQGGIDHSGRLLFAPQFIFPTFNNNFKDGVAFAYSYDTYQTGNQKLGLLDLNGEWLVEPVFEELWEFSEGLAAARSGGKWGFIDRLGNWAIPPVYDQADRFREGLAAVKIEAKYGYINQAGKWAIPPRYDAAGCFGHGLAAVKTERQYGFIDAGGDWKIPPGFDYAGEFHYISVRNDKEWHDILKLSDLIREKKKKYDLNNHTPKS
jgi:hypothetical protein